VGMTPVSQGLLGKEVPFSRKKEEAFRQGRKTKYFHLDKRGVHRKVEGAHRSSDSGKKTPVCKGR